MPEDTQGAGSQAKRATMGSLIHSPLLSTTPSGSGRGLFTLSKGWVAARRAQKGHRYEGAPSTL